jgi:hypothetical protein
MGTQSGRQARPAADPGAGAKGRLGERSAALRPLTIRAVSCRSRIVSANAGSTNCGCEHEIGGSAGRAGGRCEATPGALPAGASRSAGP